MEYYKKVLMPIEVPIGDYCWGDGRICEHFNMDAINEGGYSDCSLNFYPLNIDKKGRVVKPEKCRTLKEVK